MSDAYVPPDLSGLSAVRTRRAKAHAAAIRQQLKTTQPEETAVGDVKELPEPLQRPDGWVETDSAVTSNFDHAIDAAVVEQLERGGCYAQHAAWEFCGYVWRAEGVWFETVWRYNSPVASYSSEDIDALRRHVNDEWGWE